jgi:drug/metabolite transporter (DMT)-like permease
LFSARRFSSTEGMGELAALGTALLWATTSTMVGSQTGRVPATVISAVQLLAATILLWTLTGVLLATGQIQGTTIVRALLLIATALIGPGLGDMLYFVGIREVGVARAFPVAMAGSPLFTIALAALFVGEAITLTVVLGAILTISGIVLIAVRGSSSSDPRRSEKATTGLLIVLGAALLWAVTTVALRATAEGVAAPLVSAIRIPAAALLALALARSTGRVLRPSHYGARSMITLAAAGLMGVGTGSMLYVLAIQQAGAARTAILSSTAPLFALPLAALLLRERITRRMVAGTALTIAGIWLVTL